MIHHLKELEKLNSMHAFAFKFEVIGKVKIRSKVKISPFFVIFSFSLKTAVGFQVLTELKRFKTCKVILHIHIRFMKCVKFEFEVKVGQY